MDLKQFYFDNIKKEEYHYRFFDIINNINKNFSGAGKNTKEDDFSFEIFDEKEAIIKFKQLCDPLIDFSRKEDKCWFYLVTYFLFKKGYQIKEFPTIISKPPFEPSQFSYFDIRTRIIAQGGDINGTVQYKTRRVFVANLNFELKSNHIDIDASIEQKFTEISNRQAYFNNMSTDEKLAEITNLIENMLKQEGQFIKIDYSTICFDLITNDDVVNYRKKMQCFRHASPESIIARSLFTEEQKSFFVDYGLTIIKVIHILTKLQR